MPRRRGPNCKFHCPCCDHVSDNLSKHFYSTHGRAAKNFTNDKKIFGALTSFIANRSWFERNPLRNCKIEVNLNEDHVYVSLFTEDAILENHYRIPMEEICQRHRDIPKKKRQTKKRKRRNVISDSSSNEENILQSEEASSNEEHMFKSEEEGPPAIPLNDTDDKSVSFSKFSDLESLVSGEENRKVDISKFKCKKMKISDPECSSSEEDPWKESSSFFNEQDRKMLRSKIQRLNRKIKISRPRNVSESCKRPIRKCRLDKKVSIKENERKAAVKDIQLLTPRVVVPKVSWNKSRKEMFVKNVVFEDSLSGKQYPMKSDNQEYAVPGTSGVKSVKKKSIYVVEEQLPLKSQKMDYAVPSTSGFKKKKIPVVEEPAEYSSDSS